MLYEFKKKNSEAEATLKYLLSLWRRIPKFAKFRSRNFNIEDEDRTGRSVEFEELFPVELFEENPTLSVRE